MPTETLIEKLHIKPNQNGAIFNAPKGFIKSLTPFPGGFELKENLWGRYDFVLLFVNNIADLEQLAPKIVKALERDAVFWVAYPQKSSNIESDISRDVGWDVLNKCGLRTISVISIDDTWSALRFRPIELAEK